MPRVKRTDSELKDFAEEHLRYEVDMLRETAILLSKPGISKFEECAFLESFTIHSRALIDFLWEPNKLQDDDVVASDYLNDPSMRSLRSNTPAELEQARQRTNKEVAHITFSRKEPNDVLREWNTQELAKLILEKVRLFSQIASEKRIGNAFAGTKFEEAL